MNHSTNRARWAIALMRSTPATENASEELLAPNIATGPMAGDLARA
nr:hypothetical protein [Collimonas silvisoli]